MDKELERAFREVASPAYIFSAQAFTSRSEMVKKAFGKDTDICYSIKANPFLLAVLPVVFSKIEVCRPGELEICKALHVDPSKIIISGVNKSLDEVREAMDYGVIILTAESRDQLKCISTAASERGITAEVLIRLSCGSLCTTEDVIARGAAFNDLKKGDRIVFHRTGAYSVYEGFSLLLSRDLPSVYILDDSNVLRLVRSRIETACFNTAEGLI